MIFLSCGQDSMLMPSDSKKTKNLQDKYLTIVVNMNLSFIW